MIINFNISASEILPGMIYEITDGSIETLEEKSIPDGSFIKVVEIDDWKAKFKILDPSSMLPIDEKEYGTSMQWLEKATTDVSLDTLVFKLTEAQYDLGSPPQEVCVQQNDDIQLNIAPEKEIETIEIQETNINSSTVKTQDLLDDFFNCYQKSSEYQSRYEDQFKISINEVTMNFSPDGLSEKYRAIFSCLLFRESSHWIGKKSDSGAVGIGQFTRVAMLQVRNILKYKGKNNFDERIEDQKKYVKDKKKLAKGIRLIEAERRNYIRNTQLQKYWEKMDLSPKPAANQMNALFFRDIKNQKAIIALSAMIMKDCELKLASSNLSIDDENRILACAGAYNMGIQGFTSNAVSKSGQNKIENWVANLKQSKSSQRLETINHLISVNRCAQKDKNYPPCGTQVDYCPNLKESNPCQAEGALLCINEQC